MTAVIVSVLGVALVAVPLLMLVGRYAPRLGLMDVPNDRSSHRRPTPRGGGIAIAAGSLVGMTIYARAVAIPLSPEVLACLAGAMVVVVVSLIDDIMSLQVRTRLIAHVTAAVLVVHALPAPTVVVVPLIGAFPLGPAGPVLSLLWIVAVTNIYNFMDGIDGLAGGQGLVAAATWGVLGWLTGSPLVAGIGLATGTSCAIFLARNWPPAKIFMGDAGSAFLGYTFAVLPLLAEATWDDGRLRFEGKAFAGGALVLWPFLFDGTATLLRRLGRGENILRAHRSHLYQRLVRALHGTDHRPVTVGYTLLALLGGVAAVGWVTGVCGSGWFAAALPLLGGTTVLRLTTRLERGAQAPGEP